MVRGLADGPAEAGCGPAAQRLLPAELRPSAGWRQPAAVGVGHRGALLHYPGWFQWRAEGGRFPRSKGISVMFFVGPLTSSKVPVLLQQPL